MDRRREGGLLNWDDLLTCERFAGSIQNEFQLRKFQSLRREQYLAQQKHLLALDLLDIDIERFRRPDPASTVEIRLGELNDSGHGAVGETNVGELPHRRQSPLGAFERTFKSAAALQEFELRIDWRVASAVPASLHQTSPSKRKRRSASSRQALLLVPRILDRRLAEFRAEGFLHPLPSLGRRERERLRLD
jgi:hypothetical protein